MGLDISDGYNNRKPLSVLDVQLQRDFECHLVACGAFSEETRTVHAQAFVKPSGAKLKRGKGRRKIVMEYADLLLTRLKVRKVTTGTRHCRCDL